MKQSSIASVVSSQEGIVLLDDGACVVELASIIAGEKFSDRPAGSCCSWGSAGAHDE